MRTHTHQYVTNASGKKSYILIPIREYEHLLREAEELEDIRLYDRAKEDKSVSIPIDEAFKMIESKRKMA